MTDNRLKHGAVAFALLVALMAASYISAGAALALSNETREKLKAGGYVILMRHAQTIGTGDPSSFSLKDCTSQRNLNDRGREQALALGRKFAGAGVVISRVLSSPWCRCVDTARLVAPGLGVEKRTELGSYLQVSQGDREPRTKEMKDEMEAWNGPGNLLVVSHQINIIDLIDHNLAQGAYAVIDPKGRKVVAVEE